MVPFWKDVYLYVDLISRLRWAASFLSFICRTISALKEISCKQWDKGSCHIL